ncbi:multiple ankyrin repeats single kh domain protein [Rutstroemia sp. NJR-2017a BBW]|nr:multiple ankyrin repeats single kh domain protein [Rutstroemia sp. NJR-2017a BBW]
MFSEAKKILTVKDDLCDGLIGNFWSEFSPAGDCPSNLLGMVPSTPSSLVDDEMNYIIPFFSPSSHRTISLYKPFGIDLIQWMDDGYLVEAYSTFDALQYHNLAEVAIPKLLVMMPLRKDDDVQSNAALLLGPPIIRAAHLFVEIGVYLITNNIPVSSLGHKLITWMLKTVPWSILRPILFMNLPTIKAFSKFVFKIAVGIGYVQVGRDLLELPLLKAAVTLSSGPLCEAVMKSHFEIVEVLLEAGSDPNREADGFEYCIGYNDPPLALVQSVKIARLLVQAGAVINNTWSLETHRVSFYPPLVAAVAKGNFELVEYLIEMGADVNIYGVFDGWYQVTALTMAVSDGRLDISQLLLKNGAHTNPDARAYEVPSLNGEASFIYPSRSYTNHRYRLYNGAVRVFLSVVEIAVALKSHDIVELLVSSGSCLEDTRCNIKDINREKLPGRVETALQIAVGNGDIKLVEFLLHNGANVNAFGYSATNYPITALALAIDRHDTNLVNLLLNHGADLNVSYHGMTLLEAARSQNNSVSIIDMLLAKNAPEVLSRCNEQRDCELQEAVNRGDKEWLKRLIRLGSIVDMRPLNNMRALNNMRELNNMRTRSLDIDNCENISILHLALISWPFDPELFQLMVAETSDLAAHKINDNMVPLLHQAVSVGNLEAVQILIRAGADVNEVYREATPLISCFTSLAGTTAKLAILSLLISSGADINVVVARTSFTTALQAHLYFSSGRNRSYEVFYFLMSKQASINAPIAPMLGRSELASAICLGNIDIIQFLLDRGADVNTPAARTMGYTALQMAAYSNASLDIIHLLLDKGADVNAPAAYESGRTALQAAAYWSNLDVVHLLLDKGADVNAPGSEVDGRTALQSAAERGSFQIVVLFLQIGVDINIRSSGCRTALCAAAFQGRLDTVQLLLQNGADMNLPEHERFSEAIRLARQTRQLVVAELLESWPTSEAGRKATAKFGHLYKGAERVKEISDEGRHASES